MRVDYKTAPEILQAGSQHMSDRAALRDSPCGERSMRSTVDAFNAIYGTEMTEAQGWQFMVLLKVVRSSQGELCLDDYEDEAAYAALAGEAAQKC